MAKKLTHNEYLKTLTKTIWTPIETYINARTKILHRCKYGHEVMLLPRYAQNSGCQRCKSESEKLTNDQYINRLLRTKWTSLEEYVTARTKILHICNNGHKNRIPPRHAQEDVGCIECNALENNSSTSGILYYVKLLIGNKFYYKIGITTQASVKSRLSRDITKVHKILFEKKYDSIAEAKNEEQRILDIFSKDRNTQKLLYSGGYTEMFDYDILGEDKEHDSGN